jgi:hypothetical protein
VLLAISFGELAAFLPLGAVLGFAALFCKRWWTQQDNAMAAAIQASDKEGAKCEERVNKLRERHDKEMAEIRRILERMQTAIRALIPIVPPDVQTQLWDLMWKRNGDDDPPPRSPPAGPPPA